MATASELIDVLGTTQYQRSIQVAIQEVARKILADPREDTADPPYDQGASERNDREKWAKNAYDLSTVPEWILKFSGFVIASELPTPIATVQAYTDADWLARVEDWVDVIAEIYDEQVP